MISLMIVEDDNEIVNLLEQQFRSVGYQITSSNNGETAVIRAMQYKFDLIILDIMLPDMSGFDVCRKLREKNINIPLLMLTSRADEFDKVFALELGADDYVTKPFSIRELLARVKALLRRTASESSEKMPSQKELMINGIYIDPERRKATMNGLRLDLTVKEFELLYLLASNRGKTFSRFELLESVWGVSFSGYEHTITSHINRLRIKIEPNINEPVYILTTWGMGYRFCE